MWQHLAAIVVVPLLATSALGAGLVATHLDQVERADAARRLLDSAMELDAVRRAVDAELLPTLVRAVTDDEAASVRAGLSPLDRERLRQGAPAALSTARAATDRALAAAVPGAETELAVAVTEHLETVRAAADDDVSALPDLMNAYLTASDALRLAETRASVRAAAIGQTELSASRIHDVLLAVELTGHASRQLPLAFGASVLTGEDRALAVTQLQAATGSYEHLVHERGALSTPALRTEWARVTGAPVPLRTSSVLAAQATSWSSAPGPLTASQVLALSADSSWRDGELARLLQSSVDAALVASSTDRRSSEQALTVAGTLSVLAVVLSIASTVVVARRTAHPLRLLSESARKALDGESLALPRRGPREVREVGEALRSTAEGLHRARLQAEAVARGDLRAALSQPPAPGRLAEVVQESVEAVVHAVAARAALRAELVHRATHDPLTGLPNRAAALTALDDAVAHLGTGGTSVAVLFVDLDGFKQVNDLCGHAAGDDVLRETSSRLLAQVRSTDVVARLGGDEFVVVAADLDVEEARRLGERLVAAVSAPLELVVDGTLRTPAVGASVGLAVCTDARVGAARVLRKADTAVYRAKGLGRGCVVVHDAALLREEAERDAVAHDLRHALGTGGLDLRWEPVVHPTSEQQVAWHAVPHWERAGREVTGRELVRVADAAGLGRDLGRWLLHAATVQVSLWRDGTGAAAVPVGVRLSAAHAADGRLLVDVSDALVTADLPASALAVSVPEVCGSDPEAVGNLRVLTAMGVLTGVEASGATPLRDLPGLPVRGITLSAELVASGDPAQRLVMDLVAAAAQRLGLLVVATGARTADDLGRAVAAGAVGVRGPHVAERMTTAEAATWRSGVSAPV